jgi:hypothetical protein
MTARLGGWGVVARGAGVSHWFKPGTRGEVYSLCRMVRCRPARVKEGFGKRVYQCRMCQDSIMRNGTEDEKKTVMLSRQQLVKHYEVLIARFRQDPALGPRLYACPKCKSVYEGSSDAAFDCSDGHAPVVVTEIARKE